MNPVIQNPLRTRADIARAAAAMLAPLVPHMSEGRALLHLGDSGAVYPDRTARMEAFSRPLWAIVPMLAGQCPEVDALWPLWREGLDNGTNPDHPEYWGDLSGKDQRMVEMAVMGVGMCLAPDTFFFALRGDVQQRLYHWLSQINAYPMPANNWVFFRLLVNLGFKRCGLPYDQPQMDKDLALVEDHHEGDGWYFDSPTQRDYYSPWGFHYYGLLYAHCMAADDPARAEAFRRRAASYAPQFAAWFDRDGNALPYGRSQTYRFAQGSMFAVMALAGVEAPGLGYPEMKGLLLGNLRAWLQKPIFTGDGLLSIGYGYPNLHMAEGYNAPGSPYWGMKAFLALALPEDHPFWTCEEAPFAAPTQLSQPHAGCIITRDPAGSHVQGFFAGNHAPWCEQGVAKYEKFAYSTAFAFSVSRATCDLEKGAFDSMLALWDEDGDWRVRDGETAFSIEADRVISQWQPYPDVTIRTEIIPQGEWHLRVHTIHTGRRLHAAEGGYAIRCENDETTVQHTEEGTAVAAHASWGISGLIGLSGYKGGGFVPTVPNANLLYPRTEIPTLEALIEPGETVLRCAVLGAVEDGLAKWAAPPSFA